MSLFQHVFAALNEAGIRYVVVDGVAVVLHGHPRLTADLDIAIDLAPEAAAAAMTALEGLGLRPRLPVDPADFADPSERAKWVAERGMKVFTFWDPDDPMRSVDVFVENPIEFEDLWKRSVAVDVDHVGTRIASIDDIVQLKRLAGRPQDHSDIEALEAIKAAGGEQG